MGHYELLTEHEDSHLLGIEDSKLPIIIWVILTYIAALIMVLSVDKPNWLLLFFFTGLIALHISLHWYSTTLVQKQVWLYFIIQGMIVYVASFLIYIGSPVVLIGLYPVLLGQCIGALRIKFKLVITLMAGVYLVLAIIALLSTQWVDQLLLLIPIYLLMNVIVVSYAHLFFRQVHARLRTQVFLNELEQTHRKVEELTLANERQRMARDLHDTLAQGLAGLIMQLEATSTHLERNNTLRAQQIIFTAMESARSTLREARLVIDELRLRGKDKRDFSNTIMNMVDKLIASTDIVVHINVMEQQVLSEVVKEHCLLIISEAIMNIIKHANAREIWLTLNQTNQGDIKLVIEDNGQGFNHAIRQEGHYGIIGMTERARLIGGNLDVTSHLGKGTSIVMTIADVEGGKQ